MDATPVPLSVDAAPHVPAWARVRDPQPMLEQTWQSWRSRAEEGLWVFGYASLIWKPEIRHDTLLPARVHGYHRALRMWSRINRGTPQTPGLVFALLHGGACRGVVMRVPRAYVREELERLWAREMPTGVYDPRWLPCRTEAGVVHALSFTLHRASPCHTGHLPDDTLLDILRQAHGRYGSTLDYVLRTHHCLREAGISDRALGRLVRLAEKHGLGLETA